MWRRQVPLDEDTVHWASENELLSNITKGLAIRRQRARDIRRIRTRGDEDVARERFYGQFCTPGDLVFDVGANLGNRVKIFANIGCRVVAFEPQAYCVDVLREAFARNGNVTVIQKAVGRGETGLLQVSTAHTISSMAPSFIRATTESGRFSMYSWAPPTEVRMVALDAAIAEFGKPRFIKIDVEGFELEVLHSLTMPVSALSFEFTPEVMRSTFECIDRLQSLASYEFQISIGESMEFELVDWMPADEVKSRLQSLPSNGFGDVYGRLSEGAVAG